LQKRSSRVLTGFALEHWCKLDVPMAQLKSLFIITHLGNTHFRSLAQALDVTQGNVTGIVDRLVEQGLVARRQDPDDRRIVWLEATDKGRELLSNLMDTQTNHMTRVLSYMKLEDLTFLYKGFYAFLNALEEHQKETKN
jgi:DNA-binding MarR family transcriptional regulator